MPQYRVMIQSANYAEWEFIPMDKMQPQVATDLPVNPLELKLFSKDIILYDNTNEKVELIHSEVRTGVHYAGILLLEQNKTFGRTQNKKRLLYKCVPDDRHLPAFLVPYEVKLGFQKQQKNKYIVFRFDQWTQQHPQGIIMDTLGDTDQLANFYEYQLYCKSLHISLSDFTNKTREQLQKKSQEEYIQQIIENADFHIEDRRNIRNIITIDPEHSTDFDDAFSIETLDHTNQYKISVYIANVYVWLETLRLWKSFSNRIATIYLPDRKRPMLPTILSDSLCSLQEGVTRFAFVVDFFIDQTSLDIIKTEFHHTAIIVKKNYRYEEHELLYDNPDYQFLFNLTKRFDKTVTDSHDIVSFWMVKMNATCGQNLAQRNIGIFRQATFTKTVSSDPPTIQKHISNLDINVQRIIQMWNNIAGQYILYDNRFEILHDGMKLKNYIHITSPIRRLVDLLNQLWLSTSLKLIENPSEDAIVFLEKWIRDIDYLNGSMRSIRKIQTDCEVLHRCFTDPTIMEKEHQGVLFDKIQKNDQSFVYMVYLTDVKLLSRLKTYTEFENYSQMSFHIYLFDDEHSLKKKIRVQPIV
jgi:exoribonuclease R